MAKQRKLAVSARGSMAAALNEALDETLRGHTVSRVVGFGPGMSTTIWYVGGRPTVVYHYDDGL